MLGAGDGHDVFSLGEQPSKRNLPRLRVLRRSDLAHRARRPHVGVEVLPLIARIDAPKISFRILLRTLDLAGQEAASQGTEGHEPDTEFTQQRNDFGLEISLPE